MPSHLLAMTLVAGLLHEDIVMAAAVKVLASKFSPGLLEELGGVWGRLKFCKASAF